MPKKTYKLQNNKRKKHTKRNNIKTKKYKHTRKSITKTSQKKIRNKSQHTQKAGSKNIILQHITPSHKNIINNNNITPTKLQKFIMYKIYQNNRDLDPTHNNKLRKSKICQCVQYEEIKNNDSVETIEMKRCTAPAKPGSDFCPKHQNCMSFLQQFTNGSEPKYNPADWSHPYIEGSHNCYAYFLDDRKDSIKVKCEELCLKNNKHGCPKKDSECRNLIPQPGDHFLMAKYGSLDKKTRKYTCPNMHSRIISDNPAIKPCKLTDKCPDGYYKGAMVVDPNHTFHFYRQNPDGTWSHKPGVLPVTNKDASGNKIYIPHFADRDYTQGDKGGDIKYDDFCSYYCIPKDSYIQTSLL